MSNQELSRYLAKVLRHTARQDGIQLTPDGYAYVDDLLQRWPRHGGTPQTVETIVRNDSKMRFALRDSPSSGRRQIKATQGHSFQVIDSDRKQITSPAEAPEVLHGTTSSKWEIIKTQGLSRMGRQDIHFAPGEHSPEVISGIPGGRDIIISIDMNKALRGEHAEGTRHNTPPSYIILAPGRPVITLPHNADHRADDT